MESIEQQRAASARSLAAQAPVDMPDKYAYWRDALAGNFGPVHDSDPRCGFWRKRMFRGGPFVPVAIFEYEGEIVALVGDKPADANEIWTFVCRYPVTEEAFRAKVAGGPWPDEDTNVTASLEAPSTIGANNPPQDEAEQLKAQIDAAAANAEVYKDIRDDETASKAQSARARLNELSRDADKRREALKKPHFDAGKAIDSTWQPLVKAAKAAADIIASALSAHETRKARAAEEASRKAEAEIAHQAEEARKSAEAGKPAPIPPAPTPESEAPPITTTIRGAYGRGAAVKVVKIAKVVDYDAAYQSMKTHPELKQCIDKLAQRAVDAGHIINGVEIIEKRKVS